MEIVIDDRERAIIPSIEIIADDFKIPYKIQRCEVGDYCILHKSQIVALIERKTWEDLAASFRDGRKQNIEKLKSIRDKTNCKIFYIIEGVTNPPPKKLYSRIPAKNLISHLDHLMFRDDVHIIHVGTPEECASRLFTIANNFLTCKKDVDAKKDIDTKTGSAEEQNVDHHDLLKEKVDIDLPKDQQIIQCLPSAGSIISALLAKNNITLWSIHVGNTDVNAIASLKYDSGAMIGLAKAQKIVKSAKKLDSSTMLDKKLCVKILTQIPLITKKTAEIIINKFTLSDILRGKVSIDDLSSVKKTEKTKLGKKAVQNIYDYLKCATVDDNESENDSKSDSDSDSDSESDDNNDDNDVDIDDIVDIDE